MAHAHHKAQAKQPVSARVLTCSDSRTEETDLSGKLIRELLDKEGHTVIDHAIVADEPSLIGEYLQTALADSATQVVIINGGTGISPRDSTYEVVAELLDKRIDGFGELFRHLSYEEIGSAAIMSRAVAGLAQNTILVSVPGSQSAVRLAMERIILPELRHMAWLVG
jgi:molybdenum cofactor biosynthesis protein B